MEYSFPLVESGGGVLDGDNSARGMGERSSIVSNVAHWVGWSFRLFSYGINAAKMDPLSSIRSFDRNIAIISFDESMLRNVIVCSL